MPDDRPYPDWIDVLAIDCDGSIWGFEEDCFFDGARWTPIDDFDGLQFQLLGNTGLPLTPEVAKTMHFVRQK